MLVGAGIAVSAVQVSAPSVTVGQTLTATVRFRNTTTAPVTLAYHLVAGRVASTTTKVDLNTDGWNTLVTLAAGQTYTQRGTLPIGADLGGKTLRFFGSFRTDGVWYDSPTITQVTVAATSTATSTATPTPTPTVTPTAGTMPTGTWRLIWADEFTGPTLDTSKWNNGTTTWGSTQIGEATLVPSNATVEGGLLRLAVRDNLTGAIVQSLGKFEFTYGRVEWRAKYTGGNGLWPGLWLVHDAYRQAGTSEIDMIEVMGNHPDEVYSTYHWYPTDENHQQDSSWLKQAAGFGAQWHTYAVEWQADYIAWFIDGREVKRYTGWVGSRPHILLLSHDIGGWNNNYYDGSAPSPAYFDIDYVRVYQR